MASPVPKYNDAAITVAQRKMFLNWRISQQDILDAAEEVLDRARGDPEATASDVTRTESFKAAKVQADSLHEVLQDRTDRTGRRLRTSVVSPYIPGNNRGIEE